MKSFYNQFVNDTPEKDKEPSTKQKDVKIAANKFDAMIRKKD